MKDLIVIIFILLCFLHAGAVQQKTAGDHTSNQVQQLLSKLTKVNREVDIELAKMRTGSKVIFVVGDTGSGKSTLINYLTGRTLAIKKKNHTDQYLIQNADDTSMPIGHEFKSKTKAPALAIDSQGNTFVDTAGFEDTYGFNANIINGLTLKRILKQFTRKRIILVLDQKGLSSNRGQALKKNFLKIKTTFGENVENILIVISKASHQNDYKELILQCLSQDDSQNAQQNKDYFFKIANKASILPFYQVTKEDFSIFNDAGRWETTKRPDRINILKQLSRLPEVEGNWRSINFDGDNALRIEQLKQNIKMKIQLKLKGVNNKLQSNAWQKMLSKQLKEAKEKYLNCSWSQSQLLNNNKCYQSKQNSHTSIMNICIYKLINFVKSEMIKIPQELLQQIRRMENSISAFNELFNEVYVSQKDGSRSRMVNLQLHEEIDKFSLQLQASIDSFYHTKKLEEQKSQQIRKKEEQKLQQIRKEEEDSKSAIIGSAVGASMTGIGATIGSVAGPIGTVAGGVIGGIGGFVVSLFI